MQNITNREPKSQTLSKAIQILENFTPENPEWGIRDLGRDLGFTPTSIYRLVSTLHAAGYLEQNPDTRRYTLGPQIIKLASIYTHVNPIPGVALKIFEKYEDKFEYNFYLGRLRNFELIYLSVLDGRGPIKIVVDPGGSTSLYSTALGKVFLAFQDDSYFEEYIMKVPLTAFTERTILDVDQLRAHLQKIRFQGFAVNNGEHYDTIGAVGVPIMNKSKQVLLGVSLAYPRALDHGESFNLENIIDIAKEIADEISSRIQLQ